VSGARGRRRVGLGLRIVALVLAVALAPLVASAILIGQMAEVAQNFASNQAAELRPPLERAQLAYRDLIATKKALYRQLARRAAALQAGLAPAEAHAAVAPLFDEARGELVTITIERPGQPPLVHRGPDGSAERAPADRELVEEAPDGARVRLGFAADPALVADYQALGRVLAEARQVDTVGAALPRSYRTAFLVFLGAVVVVASVTAILVTRRFTRRIDRLVAGTRAVAAGDLATRVGLGGRDELAELGAAFDRMLEELERDRGHILYLQRMNTWQDVARRLAHEIKNPLTPIQLAVQQLESSYHGDDERHARTLREVVEIVGEEIAGLRRLVDAFRELGRLPDVDAQPLDLAVVIDDLARDPAFADRLDLAPPPAAVVVQGDRLLLRRLLANLVENGVQAGLAAGGDARVRLAWSSDGGRARIEVDDQGEGVAAADRARIFEPYVTTKASGTGLGLAIAKKNALEHRGDLTLAPDAAESGGARFVLTVPLA
jgi:nitrogen fixation/metabolism regulation signal transduction histidine kinase